MAARPERVGAILVAAGRSTRMGFDKVWADLGGQPVMAHGLRMLAAAPVDEVVVVTSAEQVERARRLLDALRLQARVCPGGERRRDSVARGLEQLGPCDWVVVHDAARPLAKADLVARGLEAARSGGAAVPGVPLADTIKRVRDGVVVETVTRAELWRIQTPQVFSQSVLRAALAASDEDVGDEATLVEQIGGRVVVFPGADDNLKLTRPGDLAVAVALMPAARANNGRAGRSASAGRASRRL